MAMNIKNDETERLSRELADLTGESLTGAVTTSVRERLERVRDAGNRWTEEKMRRALEISRGSRALWQPEMLSVEHGSLLYDEKGLPK